MLSSAIKSDAFIPWKESCFYKIKRGRYFIFALGYCDESALCKVFTPNVSGIVTDHVKVYP